MVPARRLQMMCTMKVKVPMLTMVMYISGETMVASAVPSNSGRVIPPKPRHMTVMAAVSQRA